jgi:hypothetical protein
MRTFGEWCKFFEDIEKDPKAITPRLTVRDFLAAREHIAQCKDCSDSMGSRPSECSAGKAYGSYWVQLGDNMEDILLEFYTKLRAAGFDVPIAIEIDKKMADSLRSHLSDIKYYRSGYWLMSLKPNECLFCGVLIIAPKNYVW